MTSATGSQEGERARRRFLWPLLGGLVIVVASAVVVLGSNYPADPRLEQTDGERRSSRVTGFAEVGFRVAPGSGRGEARDYCALLAETDAQHARGLMGRSDLAGYDGMIFRFSSDSSGAFYMRNVPMPLSVAWFDSSGRFVSAADMDPCGDRDDCPRYFATRPYRFALEVPGGALERFGVGPGAVLSVGGSCPPPGASPP